ncbi:MULTISPECIES: MMPL family transporter [unclassified Roseitalea]|uniref:efflux RND transporter permease subunit n=1 Tax=unclassified Roseitalea TaxID=2639107 RepID=UPI00273FB85B|nr:MULTISPECIES: MMPL family transporter [unclassified Roseitalea]
MTAEHPNAAAGRNRTWRPRIDPVALEGVAAALLRSRWIVLALSTVLVLVIAAGALNLRFNPDSRLFFGTENPERIALQEFEDTYAASANVLFVIAARNGDIYTPAALMALAQMTEQAWQIPNTLRVDSPANFNNVRARGDEILLDPLVPTGKTITIERAQEIRRTALGQEELLNRLVSPNGDVVGINVNVIKPDDGGEKVVEIAAHARSMAAQWRQDHPQFEIRLTGSVLADVSFAEAGQADMATLMPVMGVLTLLALLIGFSSFWATVSTVAVLAATSAAAMGFAGWAGMLLNSATAGAPVSIIVLTLASCVHLLTTWLRLARRTGDDRRSLIRAWAQNAVPIGVTCVTTAIGFLCLNFSPSPPMRDLGNVVAFGVVVGMMLCLTALPCLVSFVPPRMTERFSLVPAMQRLGEFVIARRRALIVLFAMLLPLAAVGISRIALDDDYIRYFGMRFEFRQSAEFTEDRLTGLNVIEYSVPAGTEGGVFDPDYLRNVDAFAQWLAEQDDVVSVDSLAEVLKRINRTVNGDDPAYFRIADTRELNAENLFVYELGLPVGHDLTTLISIDRSHSRVTAVLSDVTSARVRELGHQGEQWLIENAPDQFTQATGMSMVFAYLSERNIRSMVGGTVFALVLISMIMLLVLRDIRVGLLSLLPNLVPAVLAFGVWGFWVGQVNLASSVVTTMTLGIVVDDSVHFLIKYLRARRQDRLSPADAVRQTFTTVAPALVLTSLALIMGFGVLATSGFAVNQHVGMLCAITIAAALAADLLLLPPVLILAERRPIDDQ